MLEFRDIDEPAVGEDDVLVRVHAAGCGPDVWHFMAGRPYIARLMLGLRRPKVRVRGWDVAGTVEAVGANVTRFRPGDEVMGTCEGGSFAELPSPAGQAGAEAGRAHVRSGRGPAGLRFHRAAGRPRCGAGAARARVLVVGAAGGVGTLAVQIAKVARRRRHGRLQHLEGRNWCRSLGADDVIDYTREDFTEGRGAGT